VIGTVGSDARVDIARRHGASEVIVTEREHFPSRVRELNQGQGVPVVFDSLGKTTLKGSLYLTRPTLLHYIATREALLACASSLFQCIRDGLKIEIGQRFPLAHAALAHRALESRSTTRSTLLTL